MPDRDISSEGGLVEDREDVKPSVAFEDAAGLAAGTEDNSSADAVDNVIEQIQRLKDSGGLSIRKEGASNSDAASGGEEANEQDCHSDEEKPDIDLIDLEKDMSDFVVIDDADDPNLGKTENAGEDDEREHGEERPVEPGMWTWRRTYKAVDRSLKLELPGVKPFHRPPRGVDPHPRAKEPHFRRMFEEMRNSCHGYLTFKTAPMKAAVGWYNRTVNEPGQRLSVRNERFTGPNGPSRRPVREADLSLSPAMFSLMHPFVWSDESNFTLGFPQMLPRPVVKEWENRNQELISLENMSVQLRRGAQLQAMIFEEMQKVMSNVAEGESAADLIKKIQPSMSDINDLNYYLSNRVTALSGLVSKASRRVVIDALGVPQSEVKDVLYNQIGSPLFSRPDIAKLMSLSPRFDRFGNERRPPQHEARYSSGSSSNSRYGAPPKRELVEELSRLISAAGRSSTLSRRPVSRDRDRRRSRSRSPVRPRRRYDDRY